MKTKIVIVLLLLGFTCLSGCQDSKTAEQKQENTVENKEEKEKAEMQVYRTPTEKEMEILEGCNLSSDYMKEIQEKGMSVSVQSFVDTAQIMLDYLGEKYDEEFVVKGGEIPGIISGDYMIFAAATTGEYAGERFEVYYRVDEEGKGYCEDGYFAILKRMEVQEYLQNIAKEAGTDIKVIVSLHGRVGKEYDKETTIEEMVSLGREIEVYIFGYMRPEITEDEFTEQTVRLQNKFAETGFYLDYTVFRLASGEKFDELQEYRDIRRVFPKEMKSEEKYDLRYYEYVRPSGE